MAREKKDQSFLTLKNVMIVFLPIVAAIILMLFNFLFFWGHPVFDDFILFAFIIATLPFATSKYLEFRRIRKMEDEFPSFLADISSAVDSGMSVPHAIYTTKTRDYGVLSEEVQKMTLKVSWGIPFEEIIWSIAFGSVWPLIMAYLLDAEYQS